MREFLVTDEIMYNFISKAEDLQNIGDSIILGSGSDRTAIIYDDVTIIKIPNWYEITDDSRGREYWENMIAEYYKDSTIFEYNKRIFVIYREPQTERELETIKNIPPELVKKYGAEILAYTKWRNHTLTLCERLIPVDVDSWEFDNDTVFNDAKAMLYEMEREMKEYPIKVCDLHANNFGYTTDGKIKFVDLGYWGVSPCDNFYVDWQSMEYWENENNDYDNNYCYNCDCDGDDCEGCRYKKNGE